MKQLLFFIGIFSCFAAAAQQEPELLQRCRAFHQALVTNKEVGSFLDDKLSYGHSNGLLENKAEIQEHLNSKMMQYRSITEDSMLVTTDAGLGYVRFNTLVVAALNGNEVNLKLKVLEVWRKANGVWLLFARQATKAY